MNPFDQDLLDTLRGVRQLLAEQLNEMRASNAESIAARKQAMELGQKALDASTAVARCRDCGALLHDAPVDPMEPGT